MEDHPIPSEEGVQERHLVKTAHRCGLDEVDELRRGCSDQGFLQRGGESPSMKVSEVVLEDSTLQPAALHQCVVHLREQLHPGGDPSEDVHDPVKLGIDPPVPSHVALGHPPHDVYRCEVEIYDAVAGRVQRYLAGVRADPPDAGEHLRDAVHVTVVADEVQDHQPLLPVAAPQSPPQLLDEDRLRLGGTEEHHQVNGRDVNTLVEHVHGEQDTDLPALEVLHGCDVVVVPSGHDGA